MEQENIRQAALDEALVSINDRVKIGSCNMRIDPNKKKKEATYQVALDILKLSSCFNAFLITTDASTIKWSCGSLVTEKTTSDEESDEEEERLIQRRPTGVIIGRSAQIVSAKVKSNQSQKMKGIEMLSNVALLAADMNKASKASKKSYIIQQQSTCSSEGARITPEVLNEPKGKSTGSSKEAGNIPENRVRKRRDESEKADEETAAEEEVHIDVEEQTDEEHYDEVKDSEKVTDQETVDDETANDEKDDEEITNIAKVDEEMADAEKVDAEKTKEEKVDNEQSGADQAAKYDQAGVLIYSNKKYVLFSKLHYLMRVDALTKVDHFEVIEESVQSNVSNEVRNQIPKFLPKVVSEFVEPRLERTIRDVLKMNPPNIFKSSSSTSIDSFTEYELKNLLYDKIQKSELYNTHNKHLDLYNALIGSIGLDKAIAKGEIDATKVLKKRRHDDEDEDRPADSEKIKNRSSPLQKVKLHLNLPKLANLSSIELEYHLEQRYLTFSKQMDWTNPKGDRCRYDLSKPLPLQGPLGHLTIPVNFFFNNDLEYLKTGNSERKYTISITKTKSASYELEGIKDMIPRLWSPVKVANDRNS
ncbi:hypothetical protein Tco_0111177 [Tanacetum coccineum]